MPRSQYSVRAAREARARKRKTKKRIRKKLTREQAFQRMKRYREEIRAALRLAERYRPGGAMRRLIASRVKGKRVKIKALKKEFRL